MGPKYLIVTPYGIIDPHLIRNMESKTTELRELCDSRSDEWVRKELERREASSKKRGEEYEKKMESWFTEEEGYSDIDPETGEVYPWLKYKQAQ